MDRSFIPVCLAVSRAERTAFVGERPQPIPDSRPGRAVAAGRLAWLPLALAVALAAGLSGCGGSGGGPAALPVHCKGHALPGPDTSPVGLNDTALPAAPAAVPGAPHPAGTVPASGVASYLDPADPSYGYAARGWDVVRMAAAGGPALWSAAIRPPGRQPASDEPDLSLQPYAGYLIAAGGQQGQDLAAVSDHGQAGPVCTLPQFDATDGTVALLPHAGILIMANPPAPSAGGKDYWLNGYSTATGRRLWSADTQTSAAGHVDLMVSGDMAYVWQEQTGKIAAYSARTGHQSWLTDSGTVAVLAPGNNLLGVSGGRVFALAEESQSARVEALSSADGKILWKRDVPEPALRNQITLSQAGPGLLAVAGPGHTDYLLSATSGAVVSSLPVRPSAGLPQRCTVDGQPAVAVVEHGAIGVLAPGPAGTRTIPVAPGERVDVAVASTMAYVRAEKPGAPVRGYDLATGRLLWTARQPGTQAEDPLYAFSGGFAVLQGAASRLFR